VVGDTLPDRVAHLYLALPEKGLRPLKGISTAPLLADDGSIRTVDGYDPESRLWCACIPTVNVPAEPTRDQANSSLQLIRRAFYTFPFGDASLIFDETLGVLVVDLSKPPGYDESSFLAALLTAICRQSLSLAPGFLITAPQISGAGTGKGLLVRGIVKIAYGTEPRAFTTSRRIEEFEKRIEAALIAGDRVLFDNVNSFLMSAGLASALTERKIQLRVLGKSEMPIIEPNVFVAITGNGLSVSEDLTRRFVTVNLNARMSDPETRPFMGDFLHDIGAARASLLEAGLTIWRWGRQNEYCLVRGHPLGSYEDWARWVRDALLTLGCADPVGRLRTMKARDPIRVDLEEIFRTWWEHHGSKPVKSTELAEAVRAKIDPQGRGRQLHRCRA
jgi:hypothetical protein